MRFQLAIAEGKDAGRQFTFEQPQVVIGRTPECDVVLYDPGVSRQHARIVSEDDAHVIEDLGSANGTKVNGNIVRKVVLKAGDHITVGPVVFIFDGTGLGDDDLTTAEDPEVVNLDTRIVDPADIKRPTRPSLDPEDDEATALARRDQRPEGTPASALAEMEAPTGPRQKPVRVSASHPPGKGLSAAEKARIRREHSPAGASWRIFWAEASSLTRNALVLFAVLLGLGAFAAAYFLVVVPSNAQQLAPEASALTAERLDQSFGLGPDVDYVRADQKIFDFQYNAPAKAVVLIHFQARHISQGEVMVSVNSVDIGPVPPDLLGSEREHELLIPPSVLKKGETNKVAFDNTKNPPGEDTWRIWNLRVEVNHLPQLPANELLRDANLAFQRGQLNLERRDVGAANRYEAWKDFRSAWLMLEAHDDPKPDLYVLAREKVKEAQTELDHTCAKLLLEANASFNQNRFEAARLTLDHIKQYFPGTDQPCPYIAEEKREEYGL